MAKPKTQVINISRMPEKWLKLLLHLQNAVADTFVLEFPDEAAAKRAASCIANAISRNLAWLPMVSALRGRKVYVAKLGNAQKVIICEDV